jgi:hypothetical protein
MIASLTAWIERRRAIRRRWKADAQKLILMDERHSYYAAQRLAARSRAKGDRREFLHWAKVASEVARLSPVAEIDLATVQAIADEETKRAR